MTDHKCLNKSHNNVIIFGHKCNKDDNWVIIFGHKCNKSQLNKVSHLCRHKLKVYLYKRTYVYGN